MWDDKGIARLRELWAEGLSGSQVAAELGMTRNAVIGKIHRLGLSGRVSGRKVSVASVPKGTRRKPKDTPPNRPIIQRLTFRPGETKAKVTSAIAPVPFEPIEDIDIPLEQRRSIFELTPDTCRWPVGDVGQPGFFFCGGAVPEGCGPYCHAHHKRATETVHERRERVRVFKDGARVA